MPMGMASLADDLPTFAAASDAYDLAYSGASFDPPPPPVPAPTFDSSAYFPSDHLSPSSSSLSPSSWNHQRAVKRKLEPGELLSLSQLSSSLKSTPRSPAPDPVVSSPLLNNNDDHAGFDYAEELEHLREKIREQDKQIQSLCDDLDEERKAAASAVSETMEMIRRLNDEKAAAQLEARQMKQFADELVAHHEEELNELEKELDMKDNTIADLEAQMKVYRERMKNHGIEPDGESEFEESEDDGGRGIVEKPYDSSSDWVSNSKYQMYRPRRDEADLDMKLRKILTRLEMLETDRESVRRDMMAMRAEKAQLLLMRNIATRLCTQVAAERRMVKIRSNSNGGPKFSVFGVFKWVFGVFFQSNEKRGLYGLSNTSIAFLLLLGLTSFNRSRGPQRNKS